MPGNEKEWPEEFRARDRERNWEKRWESKEITKANGQTMLRSPINLHRKSNETFQNTGKYIRQNKTRTSLKKKNSVADPNLDPDPSNPYVFGPPGFGSGFISKRHGSRSGSFYHKAKIVRKTWFPLFCYFFLNFNFENDVNVPLKSNKQKNFFKINFCCWPLEGKWRK